MPFPEQIALGGAEIDGSAQAWKLTTLLLARIIFPLGWRRCSAALIDMFIMDAALGVVAEIYDFAHAWKLMTLLLASIIFLRANIICLHSLTNMPTRVFVLPNGSVACAGLPTGIGTCVGPHLRRHSAWSD